MEIKRATQLRDRFQREQAAGSLLTGPRFSTAGGPGGAFERIAMNAAQIVSPLPTLQNRINGKIPFVLGISALGDGSELV